MSTSGARAGSQRVTRSASRAHSVINDNASVGATSVASTRVTTRRQRGSRAGTPSKEPGENVPRVVNKQSKAYGASGKPDDVDQLEQDVAMTAAANPIAAAVQRSNNQQTPTTGNATVLSALEEEEEVEVEEVHYGSIASNPSQLIADLPDDAATLNTQRHQASEPSFFQNVVNNLSAWAPNMFGGAAPAGTVLRAEDLEARFMRTAVNGNGRVQRFWKLLLGLFIIVMALAITDLYRGPLLGPKYDICHDRTRLQYLPGKIVDPGVRKFGARLQQLEKTLNHISATSSRHFDLAPPKQQVNYFSPANGAVVDPYLSSPINKKCQKVVPNWFTKLHSKFSGNRPDQWNCVPASATHIEALLPWTEPDEKWCAPPGRGKLQLTVLTARPIAPTELIFEHIPKDAALTIGNAPKEVELWAQILDEDIHAAVSDALGSALPAIFEDSLPQAERFLAQRQALDYTYVPVGRWTYNIWDQSHVQTFHMPVSLKAHNMKSMKFAVRVNSNWGDVGSTCIYQVRLHGEDTSGIVEVLESH